MWGNLKVIEALKSKSISPFWLRAVVLLCHHRAGNGILPVRTQQHLGYTKMHQRKFNFCQSNVIEMDIV